MADEFGQLVRGLHATGDTIISTDTYLGVVGKDTSVTPVYSLLKIDATTGELYVTKAKQYQVDDSAGATDFGFTALVVRDDAVTTLTPVDGDYTVLRVDSKGQLWVTATDLDIRNLDYSQDNVAIKGSTGNQLVVNADGSINVAQTGAADTFYTAGSVDLVKDTIGTVVTEAPATTKYYKAVLVSGAGLCQWALQFGTTGAEVTIMEFWTTPSCPTQYLDLPDNIEVTNTETIRVRGTNREKAASPASDFTGFATLVRSV